MPSWEVRFRRPFCASLRIGALLVILAVWSLSCTAQLGGPDAPGAEITPAPETSDMESLWASALHSTSDGRLVVILDEAQLTAYLQSRLASNPSNNLEGAQVFLRDGQIQVFGTLVTDLATASALISLEPRIAEDGTLQLDVVEAQVGPIALPEQLMNAVTRAISDALTGQFSSMAGGIRVEEVLVGDGRLAIRLRLESALP